MRYSYSFVILALLLLGSVTAGELELGSAIPLADVKMLDISKEEISLNETKGSNGLLVIFSCNTCPWVLAWEDRYVSIAEKYAPKGIGIIAVNSNEAYRGGDDSFKKMQVHAKKNKYNFFYTVDKGSRLATAFGATRTPHIFLFDKKEKLVYRGAIDDNSRNPEQVKEAYLINAMDAMLAGKPVKVTSAKALGCTIKFAEK